MDTLEKVQEELQQKGELIMHQTRQIPVETYSRVVGYFRPIDQWNNGKKAEFADRAFMPTSRLEGYIKEAACATA